MKSFTLFNDLCPSLQGWSWPEEVGLKVRFTGSSWYLPPSMSLSSRILLPTSQASHFPSLTVPRAEARVIHLLVLSRVHTSCSQQDLCLSIHKFSFAAPNYLPPISCYNLSDFIFFLLPTTAQHSAISRLLVQLPASRPLCVCHSRSNPKKAAVFFLRRGEMVLDRVEFILIHESSV